MIGALANRLIRPFGVRLQYLRPQTEYPNYVDPQFIRIFERHRSNTMVSWPGCYQAFQAARHIAKSGVGGAVVQCGVWRGGLAAVVADTLAMEGDKDREFYLYDSFEGMPAPADCDVRVHAPGDRALDIYNTHKTNGESWARAEPHQVASALALSRYESERFKVVSGDVLETIPAKAPELIALLHLDTDWYESTRHEMEHLFPRLAPGGVLIVDDYWHWNGARRAVDEYLASVDEQLLLNTDSHYHSVMAAIPPSRF